MGIIVNVMIFHVQEKMIMFVRVYKNSLEKFDLICLYSGPDHGLCGCDKRCKCQEDWTGDDCSCTTKNDSCLVNNVKKKDFPSFIVIKIVFIRLFVIIKVYVNVVDVNVIKILDILGQLVKIVQ
jgi:hypothetical protein